MTDPFPFPSPANGDNYQLFDITGGHTGTFLNFDTGNVPVEFDAPTGLLTVVPEPSTWALLLLSTLALSALRPAPPENRTQKGVSSIRANQQEFL